MDGLFAEERQIKKGLELSARFPNKSSNPNTRRLVAICRGLGANKMPSDVARIIASDEMERTYLKYVQLIIDDAFYWHETFGYDKPIYSLKNVKFPNWRCSRADLSDHPIIPIESFENLELGNFTLHDMQDNHLGLSNTTLNAQKLKQIKFPSNLESLFMKHNPNIETFEDVSFPSSLRSVSLTGCGLDGDKIKSLRLPGGLRELSLCDNALHGQMDAVNELIAGFTELEELYLSDCNLTGTDYDQLSISALTELNELSLSGNSNKNITGLRLPCNLHYLWWYNVTWNHEQLMDLNAILVALPSIVCNFWDNLL